MPSIELQPPCTLHYEVDDHTDPWTTPEAILLMHGVAESSAVWYGWVPQLARTLRVVRPDLRGLGRSTPMRRDFPWSAEVIIDDMLQLMRAQGHPRFHLVGAKAAGIVARRFAGALALGADLALAEDFALSLAFALTLA